MLAQIIVMFYRIANAIILMDQAKKAAKIIKLSDKQKALRVKELKNIDVIKGAYAADRKALMTSRDTALYAETDKRLKGTVKLQIKKVAIRESLKRGR